jgi:hypothetical protein
MSKHPKPGHEVRKLPADDLKCDPGIGSSKGMYQAGGRPSEIEGENTQEGDKANDTLPSGGLREDDWGRTNR